MYTLIQEHLEKQFDLEHFGFVHAKKSDYFPRESGFSVLDDDSECAKRCCILFTYKALFLYLCDVMSE
jgi:hypothetical protein